MSTWTDFLTDLVALLAFGAALLALAVSLFALAAASRPREEPIITDAFRAGDPDMEE